MKTVVVPSPFLGDVGDFRLAGSGSGWRRIPTRWASGLVDGTPKEGKFDPYFPDNAPEVLYYADFRVMSDVGIAEVP